MLKKVLHKLKFSYFSLYSFFIFMILFSQLNIFVGSLPISVYRLLLVPVLFIIFFDLLYKKRFILPKHSIFFMLVFIFFASINFDMRNFGIFIRMLSVFLIFIIIYNILVTSGFDKLRKMQISFAIALILFVSSLTMLTDYFHLTKFLYYFNPDSYNDFLTVGRPSSILGAETNFTASRLAALIPFVFYYVFNEKKNIIKLAFALFTLFLSIIAQILTGSRMGYLTLTIIILVILYNIFVKLSLKTIFLSLIAILILSIIIIPIINHQLETSKLKSRMQNLENFVGQKTNFSKGENSLAVRFFLFFAGLDMIKKHPITGIGIGNAKFETLKYINEGYGMRYLHNSFLELGAECGIFPLITFLLLYFFILFKAISLTSKDSFWIFFSLSMVVQFINFFFLSDFPNRVFWTILMPIGNMVFFSEAKK